MRTFLRLDRKSPEYKQLTAIVKRRDRALYYIYSSYSRNWTAHPKPPRGYQITELEDGYTAEGYPYQFCRMIRVQRE